MKYPLVSDIKREISQKYQVLNADGVALRGLFVIDKEVRFILHCFFKETPLCKTSKYRSQKALSDSEDNSSRIYVGVLCGLTMCLCTGFCDLRFKYSLILTCHLLQGIIQHATINNMAFGRSVDETIRTLQAIQYVQENPDEVCPAGWKPGEVTMKPDPKGSKEYFSAL